MDYNKLAKEIHQDQKKAGWYDELRSDNTLILLIKSELFEAFEVYRKQSDLSPLVPEYLDSLLEMSTDLEGHFKLEFENNVKDSFADELADIVIRSLDFARYKKLMLTDRESVKVYNLSILDHLIDLDIHLTSIYNVRVILELDISKIINKVEILAHSLKIDLKKQVKLKLAYNKTRGKRHGNKAV